jgi:hypothetical protein
LARLVLVELRKSVDTRSGVWLLASVGVLTVVLGLSERADSPVATAQLPVSVLLPLVGLLSVTSEWSTRSAVGTFSLVPSRLRVIAAKAAAASLVAVAGGGFALAVGVAGGGDASVLVASRLLLIDWVTMMCGLAFGLLVLYSAPAVATYYVVPIGWSIVGRLLPWDAVAPWLDIGRSRVPLAAPGVTGREWAMFLTSCLLWVALPAAVGVWRVRRASVS